MWEKCCSVHCPLLPRETLLFPAGWAFDRVDRAGVGKDLLLDLTDERVDRAGEAAELEAAAAAAAAVAERVCEEEEEALMEAG